LLLIAITCPVFNPQASDAATSVSSGQAKSQLDQTSRLPNIVFILADDLGYGDLGCYGQKHIQTPNIDRMAAEGMRFTQHYSGSTVCAPSRCALMTGLHTGHAAVRDNEGGFGAKPLGTSDVTVAQVLKQAGYATAIIGKWDMAGPNAKGIPNLHGFDYSFGYLHSSRAHNHYPDYLWRNGQMVLLQGNRNGQGAQYSHDLFTREAMEYVDRSKDRPFFLYLAYTLPHAELATPEDSLKPYIGKFPEKPYKGKKPPWKPGKYSAQENPKAAFSGMISRMDRDVGSLLTKLKELGLGRNTLVIFTSDKGAHQEGGAAPSFFNSSGPLRGIKRDLYEGGIRVPFIARWPGKIKPGSTSDHVSASWDILPTCAKLAGVEVPEGIDGLSMAPTLLGQPRQQKEHEFLYWEFKEKQAVRMGDWKAVRLGGEDSRLELYNLESDLGEKKDLSQRHPEIRAKIREILNTSRDAPRI
jgi:arylsulfatase A